MMVVRDLSYHVVLFPTLSPFCFSSFSVLASLLLFHRIICNLVFEYIYSKTRLQIIRWNKSREASTENEEKQKGLNVGKRTTWYDRSLTTIILYSMTGLSHRHIWQNKKDKQKRTGHQKNNDKVWQVSHSHNSLRYNRSLTPIIL